MKRDMDLIRKILLKLEEFLTDDDIEKIQLDGYSPEQIIYHVFLLEEAGLIRAKILFGSGTTAPVDYVIFGLTWAGHDFLDACREEGRWEKAKDVFRQAGGVSFDIAKEVLVRLMMTSVTSILTGGAA